MLIGTITLALDFLITLFIPATLLDSYLLARIRDRSAYMNDVPWHHDLRANVSVERVWGLNTYPFRTDENGFRTGQCAQEPTRADNTVFVIGDSFIEGLGVPFEETVAGRLACAWKARGYAMRNLGTASFAPIIYHRKVVSSAQRLNVKPREVVVFLDICDIHDETTYFVDKIDRVEAVDRPRLENFLTWLRHNFTTIGVLHELRLRLFLKTAGPQAATNHACAQWTLSEKARKDWGTLGLGRAGANLDKIVELCRSWGCRMTLVVYPWPDQVAAKDRDSLQVRHWREWSQQRDVRFIDAFGPYFQESPSDAISKYYFPGDIHFNAEGYRLLFEEVWKTLGQ